ncbi:MAG: malonic semialdehyde reductase [Alphaproteobacteria bacterium]|nr:malonic semialdehyde reductase [Alphaproteobacteria bacterium]
MTDQDDATRKAADLAAARIEDVRRRIGQLDDDALDLLFREARTHNGWLDKGVSEDQLHQLYDIMKMGPTSMNMWPARLIFVTTPEGKERLKPLLMEGNREKTMSAPVCAIIGYDVEFWRHMHRLFIRDTSGMFKDNPAHAETQAFRNGTLQGAYLILAARALGLDCGPMSGFDNAAVDKEFFAGTTVKSNFLCALGYGDTSKVFGRLDRFAFDEVCQIV